MPMDRVALNIRVPAELKARIDAEAAGQGLPTNAYLTVLLNEAVPPLPRRGRGRPPKS